MLVFFGVVNVLLIAVILGTKQRVSKAPNGVVTKKWLGKSKS